MDAEKRIALEERIHGLLIGELADDDRAVLLKMIVEDAEVRGLLSEMLSFQRQTRAAYGFDRADDSMRDSLARLLAATEKAQPRTDVAAGSRGRVQWGLLAWRTAAAAGIVFALLLGIYNLRSRPPDSVDAVRLAAVAPQELAAYRTIWTQLTGTSESEIPWVLLRDGSGRFEYVTSKGSGTGRRGVLLRCLIVSQDGRSTETVNLLLPGGQTVPISLGTVGTVDGRPVRCSVSTSDGRVALDLNVGETLETAVGVRGTACLDARASDLGRFRLDGREFTVWAQTISLAVGEPS